MGLGFSDSAAAKKKSWVRFIYNRLNRGEAIGDGVIQQKRAKRCQGQFPGDDRSIEIVPDTIVHCWRGNAASAAYFLTDVARKFDNFNNYGQVNMYMKSGQMYFELITNEYLYKQKRCQRQFPSQSGKGPLQKTK